MTIKANLPQFSMYADSDTLLTCSCRYATNESQEKNRIITI